MTKQLTISFIFFGLALNFAYLVIFPESIESDGLEMFVLARTSVFSFLILHLMIVLLYKTPFSLISIFNLFVWLFAYGKVILYVLGMQDALFELFTFHTERLEAIYIMKVLIGANICVLSIHLAYILFYRNKSITQACQTKGKSNILGTISQSHLKYAFLFLLAASVLFGFKAFLELRHIQKIGYAQFYIGGLGDLNYYSPIIKYSHYLFFSTCYFVLASRPPRRKFIIVAVLFLIVTFLDGLKGARVLFILPLFYLIWFYLKFYYTSGNVWKATAIGVLIFLSIGVFAEIMKNNRSVGIENMKLEISSIPVSILQETGKTLQIAGLFAKYEESMQQSSVPYFLEPLVYPYLYFRNYGTMTGGQSEDLVKVRPSLNHQLTYYMSPSYYLSGGGLGSTIFSELYQLGYFFLFIVSLIIGRLIASLSNNLELRLVLFLSPILVQHVFFIARESPFPNLLGIIKYIIIYFLIRLLIVLFDILSHRPSQGESASPQ